MQTFLPHPEFYKTAEVLDYRRLGKQRVEAKQILNCLQYRKNGDFYMIDKNGRRRRRGWIDHKAVIMWVGYENALKHYYNVIVSAWVNRGYNNTMPFYDVDIHNIEYPKWLGNPDFHKSHRSNLLRKAYETRKEMVEWYSKFNWTEPLDLPYVWPRGKLIEENEKAKDIILRLIDVQNRLYDYRNKYPIVVYEYNEKINKIIENVYIKKQFFKDDINFVNWVYENIIMWEGGV